MFYDKFVRTGRLRLVPLGERAKGAVEDEVDAIVDAIIAERDAKQKAPWPKPERSRRSDESQAASVSADHHKGRPR
jgi:hypothetical protein